MTERTTPHGSLSDSFSRIRERLSARAERVAFANLTDDIRALLPEGYSMYASTNERRIVITRKVP